MDEEQEGRQRTNAKQFRVLFDFVLALFTADRPLAQTDLHLDHVLVHVATVEERTCPSDVVFERGV